MLNIFSRFTLNLQFSQKLINKNYLWRNLSSENNKNKDKRVRLPGAKDQKNVWDVLNYEYERDVADMIPRECDVVIIGGGIIGWSVAFFLKLNTTYTVTVIERDPSHTRSASVLGIGAIRQQFSEPENIQMSLYGAEFLRNVREHLSILDLDPPDIQFHPHGFLTLASHKGLDELKKCFDVQKSLGAKVELLTNHDIKSIWPWMGVDDVGGGIHGYENEGWFDQWQLLNAFQRKANSLGAHQVIGEVVGFDFEINYSPTNTKESDINNIVKKPNAIQVRLIDGSIQPISFAMAVNAGGPWAGDIGRLLGMGQRDVTGGPLPLPVEPRVQHSFVVSPRASSANQHTAGIDCPFIVDYDGLNVRRDRLGGDFVVFLDTPPLSKKRQKPASADDNLVGESGLAVNFDYFESYIRSQLIRRIPSFEGAVIRSGWASYLDYNYIDQNLIVGRHPTLKNILLCNGGSGHGIEHSAAIGRALFELMTFAEYKTIDLTNFGMERFYENLPVFEKEIF